MGWDFMHRDADTDMDFFNLQLAPNSVLAAFNHRGDQAVYLAVRLEREGGDCPVLGVVALYEHTTRGRCNYGYKLIEEGFGPAADHCPLDILSVLSPVEALYPEGSFGRKHAALWREQCRHHAENVEEARHALD